MAENEGSTGTENGGGENAQPQNTGNAQPGNSQPSSEQTFTQADVDKIVADRLERQKKKFSDYDDLKKQAGQAKTVEQQVSELQQALADRDARDIERSGALAAEKLKTRLVRDGLSESDASTIAGSVDITSLLDEGVPDEKAIDKLGASLSKAAGRPAPDPDMGRQNGTAPTDMNSLIRKAVGVGRGR